MDTLNFDFCSKFCWLWEVWSGYFEFGFLLYILLVILIMYNINISIYKN